MTDLWHKFLKVLDYNRGIVAGLLLAVLVGGWLVGCEVKTTSLLEPQRKVTATQLEREIIAAQGTFDKRAAAIEQMTSEYNADVGAFNLAAGAAGADLQRQYEWRKAIIEAAGGIGTSLAMGQFSLPSAVGTLTQLALLGLAGGATLDNIRQRKVTNRLKAELNAPSTTS